MRQASARFLPATIQTLRWTRACLLLVALLAVAACCAGPAAAASVTSHELTSTFDGSATPAGSFGGFDTGYMPLAVDSARGRVYVIDRENEVVDIFTEAGAYVGQLDGSTTTDGRFGFMDFGFSSQGAEVAVDQSGGPTQGRVYVATGSTLYAFSPSYAFLWQLRIRATGGVAVDADGDAWVIEPGGTVKKYNPAGEQIFSEEQAVDTETIALDGAQNLYGSDNHGINKYDADLTLTATLPVNLPRGVAFDKAAGELFVATPNRVEVYGESGDLLDRFGHSDLEEDQPRGIAVNEENGAVFVLDQINRRIDVFTPVAATAPGASIDPPSAVTEEEAHLTGTVNPEGHPTQWQFEYRPAGAGDWTATPSEDAGSGTADVPVEADISGLEYGTVYEVRLFAESTDTEKVAVAKTTFLTTPRAPLARTIAAAPRTTTTARLNASIDPSGAQTTYYFEWGTDTGYGQSLPASEDADGGTVRGQRLVSQTLTGLQPGTTYHYRVVAENEKGFAVGADFSFTTRTPQEMELAKRGIELVNTPVKGNQSVSAPSSPGGPPLIAPDGNRALWSVNSGTPDSTTGAQPIFLATRGEDGWRSRSIIPPAAEQYGGGAEHFALQRVSSDFSRFVISNSGTLTNFPYAFMRVTDQGSGEILHAFPSPLNLEQAIRSVQSSADLSQVVYWDSSDQQLYDVESGEPELVSLMEDGEPPACGVKGGTRGFILEPHDHLSEDATRIYFLTSGDSCGEPAQLYLRDRESGTTTLVSGPPVGGGSAGTEYVGATPGGEAAIFLTRTRLVEEDTDSASDIYLFEEGTGLSCLTCSVPNAAVAGVEVSRDLSYVYFESRAEFVAGAGTPDRVKLYVWHDGTVRFIADRFGSNPLGARWSKVSADGSRLLFAQEGNGTTTDEIEPCPAPPPGEQRSSCAQLYLYDAGDQAVECVSCDREGPTDGAVRGDFHLTADGDTVVFASLAALVPADVNGALDIYQWHNGAIGLVTDGVTKFPNLGLAVPSTWGVSDDGRDIFFSVASPITGFEKDGLANLYDARVGGGFSPSTPPAKCSEDSCQGPLVAPPELPSAGSAGVVGRGNQRHRARHHKRHRRHKHRHHHRGKHASRQANDKRMGQGA